MQYCRLSQLRALTHAPPRPKEQTSKHHDKFLRLESYFRVRPNTGETQ
ncbi:MAG: hypothetical protein ACI901_000251 [Octadecabacter sp.]|jgi:hypothetical protein